MKHSKTILVAVVVATMLHTVASIHTVLFKNNCPFDVWPAARGYPGSKNFLPVFSTIKLASTKTAEYQAEDGWSGMIWARTSCDASGTCSTGSCGIAKPDCFSSDPIVTTAPITLVYLTLDGMRGEDYYEVNIENGVNIPITIKPSVGSYNTSEDNQSTTESEYCKTAGCQDVINCPVEFQYSNGVIDGNKNYIPCRSPCQVYQTDEFCCKGSDRTPYKCDPKKWQENYVQDIFKVACPTAVTYRFDSEHSHHRCKSVNQPSKPLTSYEINFC